MIRVMIADDTLIAREGWRAILETIQDIVVIYEATTIEEIPRRVVEFRPDVLLLDLKWFADESAGQVVISLVKRQSPQTKVVAVSAYSHLIGKARIAGADAALTKDFSRTELAHAIRAVHTTESFPHEFPDHTADELSAREREVLGLMAQGLTDRAIADELAISEQTAKNHIASILSKLGATSRANAVAVGFQSGILGKSDS